MASLEELHSVHTPSHVTKLLTTASMSDAELKQCASSYNSVFLSGGSCEAALIAAGSLVELTDQVITGKLRNGNLSVAL